MFVERVNDGWGLDVNEEQIWEGQGLRYFWERRGRGGEKEEAGAPRALTALNTCLCTQAYQHPHLQREKLRGKTEMGLKSAPLSF